MIAKAVFFDLDGTLLDTVADIRAHVNEALRAFSCPEISLEQAKAYVGNGAEALIRRSLPAGAPFEECFSYFSERFSKSESPLTALYPGEKETLLALKEKGLKLAVITNKPQAATENVLGRFFPAGFFDFIGGDDGNFPRKPDPALARFAALSLRVSPRESVFVGDGETDALLAKNAGMRGIAVLWGYRAREQLLAAGAREFAEDYGALFRLLQRE